MVSKYRIRFIDHVVEAIGYGLGIAYTESCFGCQLIKGPARPKFGMWFPSSWVGIIKHMWVCQWVWSCYSLTYNYSFWLPKANSRTNQTGIWHVVSKLVNFIDHSGCVNGCVFVITTHEVVFCQKPLKGTGQNLACGLQIMGVVWW